MSERRKHVFGYVDPIENGRILKDEERAQQPLPEELHKKLMTKFREKINATAEYISSEECLSLDCMVELPTGRSEHGIISKHVEVVEGHPALYLGHVHFNYSPGIKGSPSETYHFALCEDGRLWYNTYGIGLRKEFSPIITTRETPHRQIPFCFENDRSVKIDSMNDFIKNILLEHGNWPQLPDAE